MDITNVEEYGVYFGVMPTTFPFRTHKNTLPSYSSPVGITWNKIIENNPTLHKNEDRKYRNTWNFKNK
jgi:hypothetical protein